MKIKFLKKLKLLSLLICIIFIIKYTIDSKEGLSLILSRVDYLNFIIPIIILQFLIVLTAYYSFTICKAQKENIKLKIMLSIYLKHLPEKYLPGGIWQTVARAGELHQYGISKKKISILILYENIWSVIMAALLSGLGIFYFHNHSNIAYIGLLFFIINLVIYISLFFIKIKDFVFSRYDYVKLTAISTLFWLLSGISFYTFVNSFHIISEQQSFLMSLCNYIFSYLLGLISIFTPQGIGIFELSIAKLSITTIETKESIVIIASYRFLMLFNDVLCWLAFIYYKMRHKTL